MVVIAALQLASRWGTRAEVFRGIVSLNLSFAATFLLLFFLYYYMPNRKQDVGRVAREAFFATLAWMAGNLIFRVLAPSWALQSIYGPFYVSVTLLLWGYLAGYIILGVARLSTDGFFDRRSP
jgi:membrane protein